ncbi:MAG: DUF2244 domain-containing protein [Pseudomonadota bacterium]
MIKFSQTETDVDVITLVPNLSASFRFNLLLVCLAALPSLAAGIFFAYLGLWLILPFVGIEFSVVTLGIVYFFRKIQRKQKLIFREYDFDFIEEQGASIYEQRFPRIWTKFIVDQENVSFDLIRVYILFQGQKTEIGDFLNPTERRELVEGLRKICINSNF